MLRFVPPLSRAQQAGGWVLVSAALACCFVPGFDSLGYYAALVIGGVGSIVALVVGALDACRLSSSAASGGPIFRAVATSAWVFILPPGLILMANALFVPNCDLAEGALFYGMGAGLGILFAGQLGAAVGLMAGRPITGALIALGVGLAWTARDLFHLYTDPPIFLFNPFIGFFSGAIYDDVIAVDARFVAYRLGGGLQLLWIWMLVRLGWHEGRWSIAAIQARGLHSAGRWWAQFALVSFLCGAAYGSRAHLGIEVDQATIEATLGGRISKGAITIVYDQHAIDETEAERLLMDAGFRLDQLLDGLEEATAEPMTIFVYGSPDQKRRLMGARRVQLAKPWLGQVHMDRPALGDRKLAHEMAHVLLGAYADTPLRVPVRAGVLVNAGLVEGAAVALEPASGPFDVHEKSAAMRAAGLAPDLESLLGPQGFWSQAASRAYTLTGSFLKWLRVRRGADAFKAVYGSGDFDAVYGEPLSNLVAAWHAWLDTLEISPELAAWAEVVYGRPGVFHRVCPLEIARLEDEASRALASGDEERARDVLEEVVGHLPDDPQKLLALLLVTSRSAPLDEVERLIERGVSGPNLPALYRARFEELGADARWRQGDLSGAAEVYEALARQPLSSDRARLVRVKADVVRSEDLEPVIGPYLLNTRRDVDVDLVYLTEAVASLPATPLPLYLLGRRAWLAGRVEEAAGPLRTALKLLERPETRGGLRETTAEAIEREVWRMLGRILLQQGKPTDAEAAFARAAQLSPNPGARQSLLDWGARANWERQRSWLKGHGVF